MTYRPSTAVLAVIATLGTVCYLYLESGVSASPQDAAAAASKDSVPVDDPVEASGTETGDVAPAQPAAPTLPPMTFVTYNVGLAHGAVAMAEERLPKIVEALAELDADVVCLQEVWTDEDADAIMNALESSYPHMFRERTEDTSEPTTPCGVWKAFWLDRCVTKRCSRKGISAEECVSGGPCEAKYDGLDDDCKRCLAANTSSPTSCALGGAQDFVSRGRNGLLLVSRHPMENPAYTSHEALLVKRGMITARINGYNAICTHLTADFGQLIPYPPEREYTSWEEEHAGQLEALFNAFPESDCTVLMGDLNTGKSIAGLSGELDGNFHLIESAGFQEPWENPVCTWCQKNPLTGSKIDKWIDHILFRGCPEGAPRYSRIMDQSIEIEGITEPTRLSDHFGLMCRTGQE